MPDSFDDIEETKINRPHDKLLWRRYQYDVILREIDCRRVKKFQRVERALKHIADARDVCCCPQLCAFHQMLRVDPRSRSEIFTIVVSQALGANYPIYQIEENRNYPLLQRDLEFDTVAVA